MIFITTFYEFPSITSLFERNETDIEIIWFTSVHEYNSNDKNATNVDKLTKKSIDGAGGIMWCGREDVEEEENSFESYFFFLWWRVFPSCNHFSFFSGQDFVNKLRWSWLMSDNKIDSDLIHVRPELRQQISCAEREKSFQLKGEKKKVLNGNFSNRTKAMKRKKSFH